MKSHLQYFDFMPFTPYIVCGIKKQLWSDLSNKTSSKEFRVASFTDNLILDVLCHAFLPHKFVRQECVINF